MAFRKTDEEKAAEASRKQWEAWAASPVGQAHAAREQGAAFFQIEIPIAQVGGLSGASTLGSSSNRIRSTGGKPDLLGQIEEVGWKLEHVGYVFVETGSTSSNRIMSTGQGTVTRGQIMGIYLFRSTNR